MCMHIYTYMYNYVHVHDIVYVCECENMYQCRVSKGCQSEKSTCNDRDHWKAAGSHKCMAISCRPLPSHHSVDTLHVHVHVGKGIVYIPYTAKFSLAKIFAKGSYFVLGQKFRQI